MSEIFKIFVPTHQVEIEGDDTFVPIQVGADLHPELDLCAIKDNSGTNISNMNGYYCELTAHFWVWKHAKEIFPNIKYVGFCHYRRFFNFGLDKNAILEDTERYFTNPKRVVAFDKESDGPTSILYSYFQDHIYQDMDVDLCIMKDKYPEWYKYSINYLNTAGPKFNARNCYIMSWEMFDKMCTMLFDVLFEHDKFFGITPENYKEHGNLYATNPYSRGNKGDQTRFNGYTSERLISAWIHCYSDNITEYPFANVKDTKIVMRETQKVITSHKNAFTRPVIINNKSQGTVRHMMNKIIRKIK